ncbi:hypothetical protein C0995_016395 [Termitomyces sp. Mi166|nr:hypothetical protein C0995_016395 [Termitomyces sp. Mi166\
MTYLSYYKQGVPPATLAEFTFEGDGSRDFYDGPDPLKGPFDASGAPVGCKSACLANLDGNPGQHRNKFLYRSKDLTVTLQLILPIVVREATTPRLLAPLRVFNFTVTSVSTL